MNFCLKPVFFFIIIFNSFLAYSQNKEEILEQGKLLYKSEKASWQGTDLLLERYEEKAKKAGGYFSYTQNDKNINVFYSRDSVPKVIITFSFDDTFITETAKTDTITRDFTDYEKKLYIIRKKAMEELASNKIFEFYNGTNFNPVPLIYKDKKMVYFFTAPKSDNTIIFGNDYLLTFNDDDSLQSVKKLHNNIIPLSYSDDEVSSMHSHSTDTGDIITATDVCILMLYSPFTYWENHYILSAKYVSVWDCRKNDLRVLDRDVWEKAMIAPKTEKENR